MTALSREIGGRGRADAVVDCGEPEPGPDGSTALRLELGKLKLEVPERESVGLVVSDRNGGEAPVDNGLRALPGATLEERRRIEIDGSGLSASEYLVSAAGGAQLDERGFLDGALGANIFAITLDRGNIEAGEAARLIVVRRGAGQ